MEKVRVVPAAYKFQLATDGATQGVRYVDLELPQVVEWGPYLEQITATTQTESRSPQFKWKVVFWWSVDGREWSSTSLDLFSYVSADGSVIQPAYPTTTQFGPKMRFALAAENVSGTNVESATVTLLLAFQFRS